MKMKETAVAIASFSLLLSLLRPAWGLPFVLALTLAYAAWGVWKSAARHLDPLNDVPNALRVLLASLGGFLISQRADFVPPSMGIVAVALSVFLNDEYQRRAFRAYTTGRKGGTVVLLGIDGSGKSTHADALKSWFERKGYRCERVQFHRYLFLSALVRRSRSDLDSLGTKRGGNPLRPLLSLADNMLLFVSTSIGAGLEGKVVIYDRYIWSTFVKYRALGYPVAPLSRLYLFPRPTRAVVLDVPVSRSLGVIGARSGHIPYRSAVLSEEREEYLRIAKARGLAVIDSTRSFAEVHGEIESELAGAFPLGGPVEPGGVSRG